MNTVGVLLKKELGESVSAFTTRRNSLDIPGKILSAFLAAGILCFVFLVLHEFADMYIGIKINRVSAPYSRLYELVSAVYTVIIVVNVLSGIRTINRSLLKSDDLRIFLTLPVSPSAMYASKMIVAYIKQFVFAALTVAPVTVVLSTVIELDAVFFGMTAVIVFLLPMISLALGSLLALPVYVLMRAVSSRYVFSLIIVTAVTAGVFVLYSEVLGLIAHLLSTGDAKYFFDAETMRTISSVTSRLYPAVFFADMLTGRNTGAAFGWILLITVVVGALGVLVGRLMLVPVAQDKLFSGSSRHVYAAHTLPAPRSVFFSFMRKELVQVVRTPSYAFRYFSTALVMPLMVYFCMDIFSSLVTMVAFIDCNFEIAVFLMVMFGALTNTYCATNVSRDGEFFFTMKTLPLDWKAVLGAKIAFCFIASAVSSVISVAIIGGLGYIDAGESVFLLAVSLVLGYAAICFATRKDLNHPRFTAPEGGEADEGNATLSALLIVGLLASFVVGIVAFFNGLYIRLNHGNDFGSMISFVTVAAIVVVVTVLSQVYLFRGLGKKYNEISEGGV